MHLKTILESGAMCLRTYSEEKFREIVLEANSYVLRRIHSYGDDYGGSHCSDERAESCENIGPELILVKKGHFAGVCLYTDFDYTNGGSCHTVEEVLLLVDGSGASSARSGVDFSNDDHSRWDYVEYELTDRGTAEKRDDRQS